MKPKFYIIGGGMSDNTSNDDKNKSKLSSAFDEIVDSTAHINAQSKALQTGYAIHQRNNPNSTLSIEDFAKELRVGQIKQGLNSERVKLGLPAENTAEQKAIEEGQKFHENLEREINTNTTRVSSLFTSKEEARRKFRGGKKDDEREL